VTWSIRTIHNYYCIYIFVEVFAEFRETVAFTPGAMTTFFPRPSLIVYDILMHPEIPLGAVIALINRMHTIALNVELKRFDLTAGQFAVLFTRGNRSCLAGWGSGGFSDAERIDALTDLRAIATHSSRTAHSRDDDDRKHTPA
jgi:hypothetical protein